MCFLFEKKKYVFVYSFWSDFFNFVLLKRNQPEKEMKRHLTTFHKQPLIQDETERVKSFSPITKETGTVNVALI